jgi:hypothetical protein
MNKPYSHCKRKIQAYLLKRKQQRCKHEWQESSKPFYTPGEIRHVPGTKSSYEVTANILCRHKWRCCAKCNVIDDRFNYHEMQKAVSNALSIKEAWQREW